MKRSKEEELDHLERSLLEAIELNKKAIKKARWDYFSSGFLATSLLFVSFSLCWKSRPMTEVSFELIFSIIFALVASSGFVLMTIKVKKASLLRKLKDSLEDLYFDIRDKNNGSGLEI